MVVKSCLIVDLGIGNSLSLYNFLIKLNHNAIIANSPKNVENIKFDYIFLPGVGSFDYAASTLQVSGWKDYLSYIRSEQGTSIVGICLGMHLLSEGSEEGKMPGLGLIPGYAIKFDNKLVPVPHMGWNTTKFVSSRFSLDNILGAKFYFAHSYYFPYIYEESTLAVTEYEVNFASAVFKNNVIGIQFHPEKSHKHGFKLMERILNLA
jgi:glutamine amidotransferase